MKVYAGSLSTTRMPKERPENALVELVKTVGIVKCPETVTVTVTQSQPVETVDTAVETVGTVETEDCIDARHEKD